MTIDASCRSLPRPSMTVIQPPEHGRVRFVAGSVAYTSDDTRFAHCQGVIGKGTGVVYQPIGAPRADRFGVRIRFENGEVRHVTYQVAPR
jgi:hypothetical protein